MILIKLAAATVLFGVPSPPAAHYWTDQLDLPDAWALSTGRGVTVGVLDTGVNADHPDLAGAVLAGKAFPNLGLGTRDAWGHGTAVAMLIAGQGRAGATRGVAPDAKILPVTTSGTGATVNEAIRWLVDQHVAVINLSVGRSPAAAASPIEDAVRYAADHDVVVVAAAGNSGEDTGVVSPANVPGVIAVSAVDSAGHFRADVSVSGPEVALAAPGVAITTAAEAGPALSPNGTSYSAAVVSGVVALVRAKYPKLNADEVKRQMFDAARPAGPAAQYGHGIVDPLAALAAAEPDAPHTRWLLITVVGVILLAVVGTAHLIGRRRSRRR